MDIDTNLIRIALTDLRVIVIFVLLISANAI